MGQQRENHATHEEHDGIRNFETLRQRGQCSDQEHEKENCELEVVNACGLHGAVSRESRLTQRTTDSAPRAGEAFTPPKQDGWGTRPGLGNEGYTVAEAKLTACACSCSACATHFSKI